jgi:dTDP-4-dehydrorhamnose reductase
MSELGPLEPFYVVGAGGMLGRAWCALLRERALAFRGMTRSELDVLDATSIAARLPPRARTVINCAAWTDVDGAETQASQADRLNALAVAALAERCQAVGALLIHYSTDYVFDGRGREPYRTDAATAPVNAYGRSKERGERLLQRSQCAHLLVRTSWLYAPWSRNFVRTIAQLASRREQLRVVHDQWGTPTSAEFLARQTLALLEHGARGTFHVTDGGACNRFEFARAIVRGLNLDCRIEPSETDPAERAAQRPAYAVLDLSATTALLGVAPGWPVNLASVLPRLEPA